MQIRRKIVGGNWKSNLTFSQVSNLIKDVLNVAEFDQKKVEVIVAPVFPHIDYVMRTATNVQVAAQNASASGMGAFTGEISAKHLQDYGIEWVIIGHSERRTLFGETNEVVANKVKICVDNKLKVIACVGEKLEDRENKKTEQVVLAQLQAIKDKLTVEDWAKVVIAYEPVWAIGTGKVASKEQAQEVHQVIRKFLYGISYRVGDSTRIMYGGSVTAGNCQELISQPDIDGFLVGGASLKPEFLDIIKSCDKARVVRCLDNGQNGKKYSEEPVEKKECPVCGGKYKCKSQQQFQQFEDFPQTQQTQPFLQRSNLDQKAQNLIFSPTSSMLPRSQVFVQPSFVVQQPFIFRPGYSSIYKPF